MVKRLAIPLVVLSLTIACGGGPSTASAPTPSPTPSPERIATITQTLADCTLSAVASHVTGPRVSFTFVDKTGVNSAFDLWLVPPGKTYADSVAFIARERKLAEARQDGLGSDAFFPGGSPSFRATLTPNESKEARGYIGAGTFAMVCLRDFPNVGLRPSSVAGPITVTG